MRFPYHTSAEEKQGRSRVGEKAGPDQEQGRARAGQKHKPGRSRVGARGEQEQSKSRGWSKSWAGAGKEQNVFHTISKFFYVMFKEGLQND